MKKALVTGAAGFIGSNVVKALLDDGVEVRALTLAGEDLSNLAGLDVDKIEGDVLDPLVLDRALAGCDALFHLAAVYKIWHRDRGVFYRVNLQGSRNVLWAARRAEVEKVVFTSSIAGIGIEPGSKLANEDTEFNVYDVANDYILTKYLSQEEALTFAREGLPLVVVNPCFPVGAGDVAPTPTGKMIIDTVNGVNPAYFKGGLNVVDVRDVARGHLLAAKQGKVGEKYILGGHNLTVKKFFKLIGSVAGVRTAYIPVSVPIARSLGYLLEKWADRTGRPPLMTSKEIPTLARYAFYDVSKAKEQLGLEITPIEESLGLAIDWFREQGRIRR